MKLLSIIYGFIVFLRNKLYDLNIFKEKKVDGVEIICIGNIVAGGTGKTPAVQYFVQKYLEKNKKVGILSRGYKGKRETDLLLVRDEKKIYATSKESGDEAYLHALNFQIPVVVCKNRYEGATFLKEKCTNAITIEQEHLPYYHYVNLFKIYAKNLPFWCGNLDVFIDNSFFSKHVEDFVESSKRGKISQTVDAYFKKMLRFNA